VAPDSAPEASSPFSCSHRSDTRASLNRQSARLGAVLLVAVPAGAPPPCHSTSRQQGNVESSMVRDMCCHVRINNEASGELLCSTCQLYWVSDTLLPAPPSHLLGPSSLKPQTTSVSYCSLRRASIPPTWCAVTAPSACKHAAAPSAMRRAKARSSPLRPREEGANTSDLSTGQICM
jgi:hypothetical protein